MVLTDTWSTNNIAEKDSLLQIQSYTPVHQKRSNNYKGGGIAVLIHDKLDCKILNAVN